MDIIPIIIGIVALSVAIFAIVFSAGRWSQRVESRLKQIEKSVNLLLLINKEAIIELYKKQSSQLSNPVPISPDKDELLKKLTDGTINRNEALRLRDILEEEKKKAEAANAIGAILAIIGLIALVKIILDMLSK